MMPMQLLVEPLEILQINTISYRWDKINQQFATTGVQPHIYVLDNEVSNTFNQPFEKYTVNYQLVPAHAHRINILKIEICLSITNKTNLIKINYLFCMA